MWLVPRLRIACVRSRSSVTAASNCRKRKSVNSSAHGRENGSISVRASALRPLLHSGSSPPGRTNKRGTPRRSWDSTQLPATIRSPLVSGPARRKNATRPWVIARPPVFSCSANALRAFGFPVAAEQPWRIFSFDRPSAVVSSSRSTRRHSPATAGSLAESRQHWHPHSR